METSLYLVSNVIRIYAISIFLDSFFGNLKCKRIIKIIAYISYYFIGSLELSRNVQSENTQNLG